MLNFGLALFVNALIWCLLMAVLYIQFVIKGAIFSYISMILSTIDQLSCAFIFLSAFLVLKKVKAGFNDLE